MEGNVMNELILKKENLPANIEDLTRFVLIGRDKLISVRAEIRAINKLGLAKEVREQKRDEAQFLADALLDAEAKMGDLLKISDIRSDREGTTGKFKEGKKLPEGITKKQ